LCNHFKISMDQLLHLESDALIFQGIVKNNSGNSFEVWLENLLRQFQYVNGFERKHLYYLLKDIPPFSYFQIPELATFKCFFWMKSILHYDAMKGVKFAFDDPRYLKYADAGKKIIHYYNLVPTTEIWSVENINNTLRQIEFYLQAGSLTSEDAKIIYDKTEDLLNHLERQAELGVKFNIGQEPTSNAAQYRLFVNELILGDNSILAELNDTRVTFLNHGVIYFVATRNEQFNTAMHDHLTNLMKKSTMISTVGEKDRVTFFNRLRNNLHQRRALLK